MAMGIAAVAGAFSVLVVLLMLAEYRLRPNKEPLDPDSWASWVAIGERSRLLVDKSPLHSAPYEALKAQLVKEPRNEDLKRQIRMMDLRLRETYFRQRQFTAAGGWLLFGGAAATLAALLWAGSLRKRLPEPSLQPVAVDLHSPIARSARWLVAAMGLVLAGAAIGLSMTYRSPLPGRAGAVASNDAAGQASSGTHASVSREGSVGNALRGVPQPAEEGRSESTDTTAGLKEEMRRLEAAQGKRESYRLTHPSEALTEQPQGLTEQHEGFPEQREELTERHGGRSLQAEASLRPMPTAAAGDYPSDAEIEGNWPRFRGPDGLGVARHKDVPTTWDVPGGKGVVWKSPVPLPGNSSPVVWKDRVFVTGGSIDQREVYCYSAADGKLLWRRAVAGPPGIGAKLKDLPEEGGAGVAAPTPTTDGRRVYAIFGTGDVAAVDFDGNPVWTRSLGIPKSSYGFASSPTLYRGRLLIQLDQGAIKDKLSKLLALDAATGKTAWETPRTVPNSWPSPILIRVGGRAEIVTSADPYVIAYDPEIGGEIWRAKCLRQDVGPSPTFFGGVVYAVSQFPQLSAIRADGKGDVSKTSVLWIGEDGLPDTCSPLASEEFVLLLSSDGMLTCYEAKKGEKLWEEEFKDSNFSSSPSLVGKQVYLFSTEGKSWVVEPTREKCQRIAEGNLGEKCVASPAFQDGRLYMRGEKNLFCLGK
jgi:outer membrane protein assembly factor BamB